MKLKLGKMSSKEVAQWLGISYSTYRNSIDKYLEKLESFCIYEKVYGGIIVKEIFIEEYDKTLNLKADIMYYKEIRFCVEKQDGLSTVAGMSRKLIQTGEFKSFSTAKRHMTRAGNLLFGKVEGLHGEGIAGARDAVWGIKLDDYNHYRLMTEEEEAKFNEILKTYYSSNPDKIKQAALLDIEYKNSDSMTKEEYYSKKEMLGLELFADCIYKFMEMTGFLVVHCTKHDLLTNFALTPEEKAYIKLLESKL